ncbi:IMPACT family protein [Halomonas sp. 1513]|nr:YigZ family protein [Halomonas sp. 1513]APX91934.1 IMPACT family protein [Halomonas sp. 1513]
MGYPIPDLEEGLWLESELEVEKSRFIAWLCHAPTAEAFESLLAAARQAHPGASHHCSAFVAGPPGEQQAIGFSDDGEPGGTAGRPMFQVLEGAGIGQVGCVVIRYFGGTKLGTGGLARAYAQAVSKGLEQLPLIDFTPRRALTLGVDFAGEAEARSWLSEQQIPVRGADYHASGVSLRVGWPADQDPARLSELTSRLKGRLSVGE